MIINSVYQNQMCRHVVDGETFLASSDKVCEEINSTEYGVYNMVKSIICVNAEPDINTGSQYYISISMPSIATLQLPHH